MYISSVAILVRIQFLLIKLRSSGCAVFCWLDIFLLIAFAAMPAPDVAMTIEDVRNEDWPVQVKNDHLQLTEAEHTDEHHLREFWYISNGC